MYTNTASILVDIVLFAALAISIFIGIRNGLFRTLMDFAVLILAVLLAVPLSGWLAGPATNLLYPHYEERINQLLDEKNFSLSGFDFDDIAFETEEDGSTALSDADFAKVLSYEGVRNTYLLLRSFGMSASKARAWIVNTLYGMYGSSDSSGDEAADDLTKALFSYAVRAVLVVVLFIALVIVLGIFARMLGEGLSHITVLNAIDNILGAVLGLAICLVFVFLALCLLPLFRIEGYDEAMDASILWKFLAENNPIRMLIS